MKMLVAVPCGDMCYIDFTRSCLSLQHVGEVQYFFAQGSLVYDARNQLADIAIDHGFDRVLWLDSDMAFPPDTMLRLSADIDNGADLVTALCFTRKRPIKSTIYSAIYTDDAGIPHADAFTEWPDEVFPVAGCGFAVTMCTTDLLRKIRDKYKRPFSPIAGYGEDLSFCLRAKELGATMCCDPSMRIGHVGIAVYTEDAFKIEKEARK